MWILLFKNIYTFARWPCIFPKSGAPGGRCQHQATKKISPYFLKISKSQNINFWTVLFHSMDWMEDIWFRWRSPFLAPKQQILVHEAEVRIIQSVVGHFTLYYLQKTPTCYHNILVSWLTGGCACLPGSPPRWRRSPICSFPYPTEKICGSSVRPQG